MHALLPHSHAELPPRPALRSNLNQPVYSYYIAPMSDSSPRNPPSSGGSSIVTVSYHDLISLSTSAPSADLLEKIGKAYGDDVDEGDTGSRSLGILAVTDVPNLFPLRSQLLPLARRLANLEPSQLSAVEVADAGYQVGWSHGKEKLEGDKYDTGKGSFYFNPLVESLERAILNRRTMMRLMHTSSNIDGQGIIQNDEPVNDDEFSALAKTNPAFFAPNVWPNEALPELEDVAKELANLVISVGRLVARACDGYVESRCPTYPKGKLEAVLTQSLCCKARLLHYFPATTTDCDTDTEQKKDGKLFSEKDADTNDDTDYSTWCGWHNDHGSLTGLVPAMYLNADGEEVPSPDPAAGLYIKSRLGDLVHVRVPPNALCYQIGETSQIHTGGILQATPHAVRGCSSTVEAARGVSRETLAVFMEPEYHGDMDLPKGRTLEQTQRTEAERHLPQSVRVLRSRWKKGMNFGEFSEATFQAFH